MPPELLRASKTSLHGAVAVPPNAFIRRAVEGGTNTRPLHERSVGGSQ